MVMEKKSPASFTGGQVVLMVAGIAVFALLMGIRQEFESMWIRAAVAAGAFMILGMTVAVVRRIRASDK